MVLPLAVPERNALFSPGIGVTTPSCLGLMLCACMAWLRSAWCWAMVGTALHCGGDRVRAGDSCGPHPHRAGTLCQVSAHLSSYLRARAFLHHDGWQCCQPLHDMQQWCESKHSVRSMPSLGVPFMRPALSIANLDVACAPLAALSSRLHTHTHTLMHACANPHANEHASDRSRNTW